MVETATLIIGASAAGLACAASLKKQGEDYVIVERSEHVAACWRSHYDRLHLHTNRGSSHLPFMKMPRHFSKYPSRDQVVEYLQAYQRKFDIDPVFNRTVSSVRRVGQQWHAETDSGEIYCAHNVIFCTGNARIPHFVDKPGIDGFAGEVLHSSEYKNGTRFTDKNVLIIGFGNSACEIAICIHEHGGRPSMSVRSPVNVIPRDVFGIPALQVGIVTSHLPPRLADRLNKPLIDLIIGDIAKCNLRKLPYGPMEQIVQHNKIPLLDIGTMHLIKEGEITVYPDIRSISNNVLSFEDGRSDTFDAIIMGTGYSHALGDMIDLSDDRLEDLAVPIHKRKMLGKDGLFFCGFYVSPAGMLREIRIESVEIARRIRQYR